MREYLQMIIWMLIFVIVVDMIFPDSAYRKYIKLILGCILVYTLVQPIIGFLGKSENGYDNYVKYYQGYLDESDQAVDYYNNQKAKQEEVLKSYYEDGVKQIIESEFDVKASYVDITYTDNTVSKIKVVVTERIGDDIEIGTIKIGDKSDTLNGNQEIIKNKIKTCLSDFYNVQDCNIHITVQKN